MLVEQPLASPGAANHWTAGHTLSTYETVGHALSYHQIVKYALSNYRTIWHQLSNHWTVGHKLLNPRTMEYAMSNYPTIGHTLSNDWTIGHTLSNHWTAEHTIFNLFLIFRHLNKTLLKIIKIVSILRDCPVFSILYFPCPSGSKVLFVNKSIWIPTLQLSQTPNLPPSLLLPFNLLQQLSP